MTAGIDCYNAALVNHYRGTGIIGLIGTVPFKSNEFRIGFAVNQDPTDPSRYVNPSANYCQVDVTGIVYINVNINTYVGKYILVIFFFSATP